MKINIIGNVSLAIKKAIKKNTKKTIEFLKQPNNLEISVKFMNANEIRELNNKTRNIDKPTDVLSYPSLNIKAGEIVDNKSLTMSSFDNKNVYSFLRILKL